MSSVTLRDEAGRVLRPWEVRAGCLVIRTEYAHDSQSVIVDVGDDLVEVGDRLASAVRERWSGPDACGCDCCKAAADWLRLRGVSPRTSPDQPLSTV